jgi:hypothetical protein
MAHQVDRVVDDLATALVQLKESMHGMPINRNGFKAAHDRMGRAMGTLITELTDARTAIKS